MKLSAFGFTTANPAASESSAPSSAETLPSSRWEAEKFTESPSLHKTAKKQEATSNSKPEQDEGQTQQASTNLESNTGSNSAPGIFQNEIMFPILVYCQYFFPNFSQGLFPKYLDKALQARSIWYQYTYQVW